METRLGKVAQATLGFWIIKIAATTLGETAGDAVTMSLNLGYLIGTAIFAAIFIAAVSAQVRAAKFHAPLFWFVIVATTTVGTTLADFADRSLGIGYLGGSALLLAALLGTLALWKRTCGSVSLASIDSPRAEIFYWATIVFSQTLGTALGDWFADGLDLGYGYSALVFGAALVIIGALYLWTRTSRTLLFWAAFILTRPLGATLGDFLDKPHDHGGLALSRYTASGALALFIVLAVALLPQRAEPVEPTAA